MVWQADGSMSRWEGAGRQGDTLAGAASRRADGPASRRAASREPPGDPAREKARRVVAPPGRRIRTPAG
ncbi:hypothetical protein RZV19_18835, partial [Burkholderia pseudomallei]